MKFIAAAQSVPAQLDLFACLGMTPTNPEAIAALAEADQPYSVTSAANLPNVTLNDPTWWGNTSVPPSTPFVRRDDGRAGGFGLAVLGATGAQTFWLVYRLRS